MGIAFDIEIGDDFSFLTVISNAIIKKEKNGSNVKYYYCICKCNNIVAVRGYSLKSGNTKACGCYQKTYKPSIKHGMKGSKIYQVWENMKSRTTNKNTDNYKYYGGLGKFVCDEWINSFEAFYRDMKDGYFEGLEIDRIDNSKGYSKDNCRWVTHTENCRNKSNNVSVFYNGKKYPTMSQFCTDHNLSKSHFHITVKRCGSVELAISKFISKGYLVC